MLVARVSFVLWPVYDLLIAERLLLSLGTNMKNRIQKISVIVLILYFGASHAADFSSSSLIEIKGIISYSNNDPSAPPYSNLIALKFDNVPWNAPTSCSSITVLVKAGDSNIVATVLAAHMSNTPVRIYVNDTTPGPQDGYCFLRAIATL